MKTRARKNTIKQIKVNKCNVCSSKNVKDLNIYKNYFLQNMNLNVKIGYSICKSCGFIFQNQFLGDKFLDDYYKSSPMKRDKKASFYEKEQSTDQLNFLSQIKDLKNKKILEIGAHTGIFLSALNKKYKCTCYYDELSKDAKKILVQRKNLIDVSKLKKKEKVDIVVLRHVLEHISDLESFLYKIKAKLNKDGSLFIEIPDWSYLDKNTDQLLFEHICQFNSHSISTLLWKNGFTIEKMEKSINPNDPTTPNRVMRIICTLTNLKCNKKSDIKQVQSFFNSQSISWMAVLNKLLANKYKNHKIALTPSSHLTFTALLETNLYKKNIVGIFDGNKKKQGTEVMKIRVFDYNYLKNVKPELILIFSLGFEPEIRNAIKNVNINCKILSISELIKEG